MKTKEKLVPELRFPEFTDEWEEKKLGEIAEVYSGGTPYTKEKSYWNGDILWVTPTDVTSIRKYLSNTEKKITKLGLEKSSAKLLPKNSILMTSRATIGEVVINKEPVTTNQGFKSFVLRDNYYYEFIYYLLKMYKQIFLRLSNGSTFLELPMTDTKDAKVKLPDFPEQEKIGNFFYKIDKKLDLQRERIEELKDYKKAMMQRIFDQEIRFKDEDGSEYPEWEEKRLGDITEVISSNIRVSDLKATGETPVYDVLEMVGYINEIGVDTDYISIIKDGSGVGRAKILPKNSLFIATMNGIKVKEENLYFVYLIIKNINFLKYMVGSGIPHIYYKDYSNEKIQLPSLPEQEKIANFLSAIDEKIELEEEKLEEFEKFKKGLMQRMFI